MNADNKYVKAARLQLKLTQEQFAERLFIARETITRYETGVRPVPVRKMLAIQNLLERAT